MTKPKPDSAEWWQEVAQGLGVTIHDLKAENLSLSQQLSASQQARDAIEGLMRRLIAISGAPEPPFMEFYSDPVAFYRDMTLRAIVDRDEKKHENRTLKQAAEATARRLQEVELAQAQTGQQTGQLRALVDAWREEARLARPLESAAITAEKRARTARWMLLTRCASELEAAIKPATAGDLPPLDAPRPEDEAHAKRLSDFTAGYWAGRDSLQPTGMAPIPRTIEAAFTLHTARKRT